MVVLSSHKALSFPIVNAESEVAIPTPGDHSTLLVSFHLKRHMGDFVIQVTTHTLGPVSISPMFRCTAPVCCWWSSPGCPSGSTGRPPQTGSPWASPPSSPWPSWASRRGRTCPRWHTPPPWTISSSSPSCTFSAQSYRWEGDKTETRCQLKCCLITKFGLVHHFTKIGSGEYYLEELENEICRDHTFVFL